MLSREERAAAEDIGDYFRVRPDPRDLNYDKFMDSGSARITASTDYNSHNTERLDVEGMKTLLMKLRFISELVAGRPAELED